MILVNVTVVDQRAKKCAVTVAREIKTGDKPILIHIDTFGLGPEKRRESFIKAVMNKLDGTGEDADAAAATIRETLEQKLIALLSETRENQIKAAATAYLDANTDGGGHDLYRYWLQNWYHYTGAAYERVSDDVMRTRVRVFVEEMLPNRTERDVGEIMRDMIIRCGIDASDRARIPFTLKNYRPVDGHIFFRNGRLAVPSAGELLPPTPEIFSTSCLQCDYDPAAECPLWLEFLRFALPDEDSRIMLQMWFGVFIARHKVQQALFLVGDAGCGKGTVERTLKSLMGNSCRGLDANSLGGAFGAAQFIGADVVILRDAEISVKADRARIVGTIKAITGEDEFLADRKHKEPINLIPSMNLAITANTFPQLGDDPSGAIRRRTSLIWFDQCPPEPDATLSHRLARELPGIAVWAIEGYWRFVQGGMRIPQAASGMAEIDHAMRRDSVFGFASDWCEFTDGVQVAVDRLFNAYRRWCSENGAKPLSKNWFSRSFVRLHAKHGVEAKAVRVGSKVVKHMIGTYLVDFQDHDEPPASEQPADNDDRW